MKDRHRRRGITLLEIMIAMSLMSVVLIAFASVFPSGYRLNFSNLNQSKAAGFATGITEQIANFPSGQLANYDAAPGDKIAALMSSHDLTMPTGLVYPMPNDPKQVLPNVFYLTGIKIVKQQATNPFPSDPNDKTSDKVAAQIGADEITVTITWSETRRAMPNITKTVSVTTLVNSVLNK